LSEASNSLIGNASLISKVYFPRLIVPGTEDFGMTMAEVQAAGRPPVAFARGGALEIVQDGVTGFLFADPTAGALADAMRRSTATELDIDALVGSELGGALQDPIITLRNGRYVVPVRADAKGKVKGIVHDQSGSGQTLFVEPLVAVELGNAWREAQAAEREEIERILDELSALVAANAIQLRETLDALARFDFWAAKAQLAAEMDGIRAETSERPEVILLSARHPGLNGRVVPIDIRLGDGYTALVVTGPNTGGKTVTLRTLGLLAIMHQAGLHIPAEAGSRLPILRDVFADIGDEQSIENSLSTFSSHIKNLAAMDRDLEMPALVLLDEVGTGTDPNEGGALATNADGEVGISYMMGGDPRNPTHVVGILTNQRKDVIVSAGDRSPLDPTSGNGEWGDYLAVRPAFPNDKLFAASGYTMIGPEDGSNRDVTPRFVIFGRASNVGDRRSYSSRSSASTAG
jgi:hypothetical protein